MIKKDDRRPEERKNFANNDVIKIYITYAESAIEFYGIDHPMLNQIQKLQDDMSAWYSEKRRTIDFLRIPEVETHCAAMVEDRWCRVKIIRRKSEKYCDVFLIDCGRSIQLKLSLLRWLDTRFLKIPPGVSRFKLLTSARSDQETKKWLFAASEQASIDKCKNICELKNVVAKIDQLIGNYPTTYAINLSSRIPDNREICTDKHFNPKQIYSFAHEIPRDNSVTNMDNNNEKISKNSDSSQSEATKMIVKMSFCVSPKQFYLQFESQRERLVRLQSDLQNLCKQKVNEKNWTLKEMCYVRTKIAPTFREHWYRGQIAESNDGHWRVYLRDYGNIVSITAPENLAIESEIIETMENMAVQCHVAHISPIIGLEWPPSAIDKFCDLYQNYEQLAVTHIQNQSKLLISTPVVLWGLESEVFNALEPTICKWTNINKEMIFQGLARLTENISVFEENSNPNRSLENEIALTTNAECSTITSWIPSNPITQSSFVCVSTYVSDDLEIYFHDMKDEQNLDLMITTAIHKFKNFKSNKESSWTKNEPCLAKYTDNVYYRAVILSIDESKSTGKVIYCLY